MSALRDQMRAVNAKANREASKQSDETSSALERAQQRAAETEASLSEEKASWSSTLLCSSQSYLIE